MDKKALVNSRRLKFPWNDRTDKKFIAQPEINLQSFKSTPVSLTQRFKAFERKPSLGAPDIYTTFRIIPSRPKTSLCRVRKQGIQKRPWEQGKPYNHNFT